MEELQNTLFIMLLAVPKTTPLPSLAWDMGGMKMKYRIILEKLLFLHHLKSLDDSMLAWFQSVRIISRNTDYQTYLKLIFLKQNGKER